MKVDKSLLSGSTTLLVLSLLKTGDMYGYELIQQMALLSDNAFSMSQGSLYPFLHTLEDKGLIQSYTQTERGRERRFYRLTPAGGRALKHKEEQWSIYVRAMGRILGGAAE